MPKKRGRKKRTAAEIQHNETGNYPTIKAKPKKKVLETKKPDKFKPGNTFEEKEDKSLKVGVIELKPDPLKVETPYSKISPTMIKKTEIKNYPIPERPVKYMDVVEVINSDKILSIGKNQKCPTTHQLHLLTRQIDAEMRMLLRRGKFDDTDMISITYRVHKRINK